MPQNSGYGFAPGFVEPPIGNNVLDPSRVELGSFITPPDEVNDALGLTPPAQPDATALVNQTGEASTPPEEIDRGGRGMNDPGGPAADPGTVDSFSDFAAAAVEDRPLRDAHVPGHAVRALPPSLEPLC